MPFKISKAERSELDKFRDRLAKEHTELTATVDEQTAIIEAAYERINGAIDTYNGVLADAHSYLEDISSQAQSDFDEKSERWQESERAEAVREWIDAIDNAVVEMEEVEQLTFEAPGNDYTDHSELIDSLEDEPSF